jgi:hypothetical protein
MNPARRGGTNPGFAILRIVPGRPGIAQDGLSRTPPRWGRFLWAIRFRFGNVPTVEESAKRLSEKACRDSAPWPE